ncbi:MAG: hypothetical protein A2Z42_04425 [Candidatus Woykebacteria bacterium RBG_19FT_COMBO_43_10]|uniref:Uncharacterized protein n=1 Tax=Candidatus Woykebacteria bacterium RBG_19FT_COMBO_43_10 TaxID=1802598 RepID=A0A1G1WG70_9BACT|nr:MAG: hypothetical protein A2Z42_04425 [Candidatus Woykebacteria bacterium RBG_19FT_COMBO_43_10]
MPTLLDVAIGLPILIIMEDQRLRQERLLFLLEIFSVLVWPVARPRKKLVDGPDELGYELVPASEFDFESDPFSYRPIEKQDVFPEGVLAHAN